MQVGSPERSRHWRCISTSDCITCHIRASLEVNQTINSVQGESTYIYSRPSTQMIFLTHHPYCFRKSIAYPFYAHDMSDAIELQSRPTATDAPEYSSGPSTLNDDRPYVTDLPTAQELGPPEDPIEANDQHPLVSGPYVNTAVDHHEMDHVASEMSQLHMEDGGVKEEAWSKWMTKINERWIFEQVSAILSVSCMVALIGVLLQAKNNAPSRWMWQSLTLNGLIALISTVMRASIMLSVGAGLGQTKWNFFAPRSGMQVSGRKIGDLNTFDQASRGPMGSFKLLFNRPGL